MPDAPTATWIFRFGDEDVEHFLDNARKLRTDGLRCRSPARLGLLELSLEQAAVGGMVLFRIILDESTNRSEILAGTLAPRESDPLGIGSLLATHLPEISDQRIARAARSHRGSLEELGFVFDILESASPTILSPGTPIDTSSIRDSPLSLRVLYRMVRGTRLGQAALRVMLGDLRKLRELGLQRLDQTVKNTAFYVRVNPESGRISPPEADKILSKEFNRASAAVEYFLRGFLHRRKSLRSAAAKHEQGRVTRV